MSSLAEIMMKEFHFNATLNMHLHMPLHFKNDKQHMDHLICCECMHAFNEKIFKARYYNFDNTMAA